MERQLTHAAQNHILTNANVWSPDGKWIVYDSRSDPGGGTFDGTRIERVNVESGEVQTLYESRRGACCGVATFSPVDERVAFIHGPEDPTPDWQYCAWHRRGVTLDARRPGVINNLDARDIVAPFTPGALRGGSHVHIFSGDGKWVSFTYEDHVLTSLWEASPTPMTASNGERNRRQRRLPQTLCSGPAFSGSASSLGEARPHGDLNQRNVAVAAPFGPVRPPKTHPRNHDGQYFSAVVSKTVNQPRPGTDDICRAYEDAWVGASGYRRSDGRWQTRALAFLGDVIDEHGKPLTELFIVDIPDDVTMPGDGPIEGTETRRPAPPAGTRQRRLTFTSQRRYPGVQGPRHWPRSSRDGSRIAFLMRDDAGIVQLWTVSPNGGEPHQVTSDPWHVGSAFTWDPLGRRIIYIADGSVMVVDVMTGKSARVTERGQRDAALRPEACVFSPNGERIAYARSISGPAGRFNQILIADA